jgi:hypothetical protein
MKVSFDENT